MIEKTYLTLATVFVFFAAMAALRHRIGPKQPPVQVPASMFRHFLGFESAKRLLLSWTGR